MRNQRAFDTKVAEAGSRNGSSVSGKSSLRVHAPVHPWLLLQQTFGNRAVQRLVQSRGLQTKLKISRPGDVYEQEADRVAEQVMRIPGPTMQRSCAACAAGGPPCPKCRDEKESFVYRKPKSSPDTADASVPDNFLQDLGAGTPLDRSTRALFEPRFGYDFGQVRVHMNAQAGESVRAVNALAYTVGRNIVFGTGQYAPESSEGRRLLAHELTHVVQQNGSAGMMQRFSTQDCDPADVTRIEESHNRAIRMLEKANARLTASPVTADTQRHFSNHFGGYGTWRRDIVVEHLTMDLNLLKASEMTYECESECDEGEPAYTYWIFGDIHICLPWLGSQVLNERGETFIHELHHWDAARGHLDLGYHKNNADNKTTWVVAVNNADAYSELVQDLYEQP